MAQIPKRLKPRSHLPRLNPLELEAFTARLVALKTISQAGKQAVLLSMTAAANPNAETPEMVIRTLEVEEKIAVMTASLDYKRTLSAMNTRGAAGLMAMADEEFTDA